MGGLIYIITALLFSLGHESVQAVTFEAQEATCGLQYQDILKEAVSLRKRCDNAVYRDCCQVNLHYNIQSVEHLVWNWSKCPD